VPSPFNYNNCAARARAVGPDSFPAFEDDGSDLSCVLRDLAHLWAEHGHRDAAVAAFVIVDLVGEAPRGAGCAVTPIRVQWNCGRTAAGMRIHLDLARRGEAGTFTLWCRDGDELHRAGAWSFADEQEELGAAFDAQLAIEVLLRNGEVDAPPRWFPSHVIAQHALGRSVDPIRDDPGAFL
jgi:hypothetical protein